MSLIKLHDSLSLRIRPEDIAEQILQVLDGKLSSQERMLLNMAAKGSLKRRWFGYTSMLQKFMEPVGAERVVSKTQEIFLHGDKGFSETDNPLALEAFIKSALPEIHKTFGENDFKQHRLNREERGKKSLTFSRRQYNKRWRLLTRLEKKHRTLINELQKRELQMISKHGLAHQIPQGLFLQDENSACFIAYLTAKLNLRSEFTLKGQQNAYDSIADMLYKRATGRPDYREDNAGGLASMANWWAIAHVYPAVEVLQNISDVQKGILLGKWTSILQQISGRLEELWDSGNYDPETMIVKRGNDSTGWNITAGAWNRARDTWMNLMYAMGTEYILDELCFGKVMRLMAGDLAHWFRISGRGLEANTKVWRQLPYPWEVFSGKAACNRRMVESACIHANVDAEKSGWIAPRYHGIAEYKPTPELVHGVAISNPFLAAVLKKHGYFSGKK